MSEASSSDPDNLQKLQKLLERINVKLTLSIPLTPREHNLVAEMQRVQTLKPRSNYQVTADGKLHIVHTNDAEPVMEGVKALSDLTRDQGGSANHRYIGSIDPITAAQFKKDSGLKIGTKEYSEYVHKRLQTTHTKFLADLGKKYH